jgi:hypothetical protein
MKRRTNVKKKEEGRDGGAGEIRLTRLVLKGRLNEERTS